MMHHSLYYSQIKEYISTLLTTEQSIVIAVSGGSDSMYLLSSLQTRRQEQQRDPSLLHIMSCDHNTRENTKNEVSYVQNMCKENSFSSVLYHGNDHDEASMRTRRHEAFITYCRQVGASYLFLGHHLDDRIETTLLNMRRGCGKSGLLGLGEQSPHFLDPTIIIVRPLLFLTKKEILTECDRLGITYYSDPTNDDEDYSQRNSIRKLLGNEYNTGGRHRSFEQFYQIIEGSSQSSKSQETKNKKGFYDNSNNFYPIVHHDGYDIIPIIHTQWNSDLLYSLYKYYNISINPRSTTLSTLSSSLHKKSGNKIRYEGICLQSTQYGTRITITS